MLGLVFRFRTFLTAGTLMVLSLWLSFRPLDQRLRIAHGLQVTVLAPIQYVLQRIFWLKNTLEENRRLIKDNAHLETEIISLREAREENLTLRRMIEFRDKSPFHLIPAEVVAQSISPAAKNIIISVGTRQQVKKDMPVISLEGVVGKVVECYPFHSNVQLINDPHSKTGVLFPRSNVVGILECKSGAFPEVRTPAHTHVLPGDTVVTSGLGGIFPKGLAVGVVDTLYAGGELFKTVRVNTDLGTRRIGHAFVIRIETQWQPFNPLPAHAVP